ncbi:MAG: response regulator [Rhodocyclaceae bacterium]|nr:MAG: response regulator [Rhodocyclaceae bacterium]
MNDPRQDQTETSGAEEAPWSLLCVDDEPNILSALRRLLRPHGYQVTIANSGAEALAIMEEQAFDLVISDMRMPEMDGARFLEQVKRRWPDTVRLLLTGYADVTSTVDAINKGEIYRYISKPWDDNELLLIVRQALERKALEREKVRLELLTARQNEELRDLNANLELKVMERTVELRKAHDKVKTSFLTSIKVFANLIELRGSNLAGHSRRVADLGRKIANRMELSPADSQDVFLAGLLHDIGKIGLPDLLLVKPVPQMTGEELGLYRKHPIKGEQSVMALEELRGAARIVRSHHERFDGQGYPDGLMGDSIPIGARILSVANDYDGLQIGSLSVRRYSQEDAKKLIAEGKGKRYDPQVIEAFLDIVGKVEVRDTGEIELGVADLKPGMILSRDLLSRDGVLLLAADYILDANLIRQIRDYAASENIVMRIHVRTSGGSHEKTAAR